MRTLLLVLVALLLLAAPARAQENDHTVFLPLVGSGTTTTPAASVRALNRPAQESTCAENEPDFASGLQVWLTETDPEQTRLNLCTRLRADFNYINGVAMHGSAYHGTAGTWFTTFPSDENDDSIASIVLSRSQPGINIVSRVWIEHQGERYKASALWPPDPLAEYALTVHEDVTRINDAMVRLTGTLSTTLDMEDQAWIDTAQAEITAIHDARDSLRRAAVPDEAKALRDATRSASSYCESMANSLERELLLRDERSFRSSIRWSSCPDTIPQAMARVNEVLDGRGLSP